MALALCPGTFDPFTYGHLDIVERACRLFDRIEVTVAINANKKSLFTVEERCTMIEEATAHLPSVTVAPFEGLLVDHAREVGAIALVRGLRQVSDFDYENRMAFANRRLHGDLDTVYLLTSEQYALIHASIVREIFRWGGDVTSFVPPSVLAAMEAKRG